jgi:hypothetical protein
MTNVTAAARYALSAYPYLFFSLAMLVFCLTLLWLGRGQRKVILLSGCLSAPYGFLSVFFVPYYWKPVRIVEFGSGIEDLIFSFSGGGIVWFCASFPFRNKLTNRINIRRLFTVYLSTNLMGITFGYVLNWVGMSPMNITYFGFAAFIGGFLLLRHQSWPLSFAGAISYAVFYIIFCFVAFSLEPGFLLQWNLHVLSGCFFLGVPIEEIAWALGFGGLWPLILCFGLDVRLQKNLPVAVSSEKRKICVL